MVLVEKIYIFVCYQWKGGGTYAHQFPLRYDVVGDFFGTRKPPRHLGHLQKKKNPPRDKKECFGMKMSLFKTCTLCVKVAPCLHMGQVIAGFPCKGWAGNRTSVKKLSFAFETKFMSTGKNRIKTEETQRYQMYYIHVLVTTITCLTIKQQSRVDGEFHACTNWYFS